MDDALGVGNREAFRDLSSDGPRVFEGKRSVGECLPQRPALDPFHRDPRAAVGLADVVDRDDGLMIERGGRAGLELESTTEGRVSGQSRRDHLQRDVTAEPGVAASVDFSHPSDAEESLDFVRTDAVAWREGHAGVPGMMARFGEDSSSK